MQTWESGVTEALTLVANRFSITTREWKSAQGQAVHLATYLFPDDVALADEYLDATVKYLDAYVPLLGPFPFGQFAVVENFFASGLGMPSFTLLGSGSIKRHYTQPYALGHEIVHSWIGNSVWNRPESGNWVEGLTTYLTNYYWHELVRDDRQAREQRRTGHHHLLGTLNGGENRRGGLAQRYVLAVADEVRTQHGRQRPVDQFLRLQTHAQFLGPGQVNVRFALD